MQPLELLDPAFSPDHQGAEAPARITGRAAGSSDAASLDPGLFLQHTVFDCPLDRPSPSAELDILHVVELELDAQ